MAREGSSRGHRLRSALVVGGITLGILLLFFLQFAIPYALGPIGLVVVGVVDAGIYLDMRHRRTLRKHLREGGREARSPVDARGVTRDRSPLEDEFVVTIALVVFVLGLCVEGVGLGADSWLPGTNLVFLVLGSVITISAFVMLRRKGWRFYDPRSESEKYDTTEDH